MYVFGRKDQGVVVPVPMGPQGHSWGRATPFIVPVREGLAVRVCVCCCKDHGAVGAGLRHAEACNQVHTTPCFRLVRQSWRHRGHVLTVLLLEVMGGRLVFVWFV